jgi:hypothetical protein
MSLKSCDKFRAGHLCKAITKVSKHCLGIAWLNRVNRLFIAEAEAMRLRERYRYSILVTGSVKVQMSFKMYRS